ncbi:MAG: helix-turn-helix domain-containing protein [Ruminococcus sp.]|nr:helix-turn-helix domain-containing protein [Ruminococcus sp.]
MSVGDNIRTARINKGLNQKELAEMLTKKGIKIGNTTICNWENGTSKPDPDTIAILCNILDVDANYILDFNRVTLNNNDKYAMLFSKIKDLPEDKQKIIFNVTESVMKEIDENLDN